jgi:CDGSH iron-sulfur domain-containing protein 3
LTEGLGCILSHSSEEPALQRVLKAFPRCAMMGAKLTQKECSMANPIRASDTPYPVTVEAGKEYWWCSCGQSKNQPYCDGSHKASGEFTPVKYTANESATVYFCGCKQSGKAPLCDGSHKKTN